MTRSFASYDGLRLSYTRQGRGQPPSRATSRPKPSSGSCRSSTDAGTRRPAPTPRGRPRSAAPSLMSLLYQSASGPSVKFPGSCGSREGRAQSAAGEGLMLQAIHRPPRGADPEPGRPARGSSAPATPSRSPSASPSATTISPTASPSASPTSSITSSPSSSVTPSVTPSTSVTPTTTGSPTVP